MIFYFSGTGNSRFVASSLSEHLLEKAHFMNEEAPMVFDGESLGFVFPVYSWGVPPNVLAFIDRLPESFWNEVKVGQIDIWAVMTCGDEVALAPEMLIANMSSKHIKLRSIWSVIMPNNYVLLPGFDVDSKEVETKKLEMAPARIKEIADNILQHREVIDVVRGGMPWLKTKAVYPLFKKWGIFPKKWHVTSACVGCGICMRNCPLGNIEMKDRIPEWGMNCCSCLACYHSCPRHAVMYGNVTASKGQYFLPAFRKNG